MATTHTYMIVEKVRCAPLQVAYEGDVQGADLGLNLEGLVAVTHLEKFQYRYVLQA